MEDLNKNWLLEQEKPQSWEVIDAAEAERQRILAEDIAKVSAVYDWESVEAKAEKVPEKLEMAIKEDDAMKEAYSNYDIKNWKIIDNKCKIPIFKNPNKITESEKNAMLMQFGWVLDASWNVVLWSWNSKFVLNTNAWALKSKKSNESTYSISREDQEKLKQWINETKNGSKFDMSNIKADFKLSDWNSYEANIGLWYKKLHEKWNLALKASFKKLIEIAERNHWIWLEVERTFGWEFQKLLWWTAISIDAEWRTLIKLSAQDLRKIEKVNLDQFGQKSFKAHQMSYAAEIVHKMDYFLREISWSVVHSSSWNHSFWLLGSQLVNDPAYKQYFEYYGYFQWATRDEARIRMDFEINSRTKLSLAWWIERIVYNKLWKNVLWEEIQTEGNTKIWPTWGVELTHQLEGDKTRLSAWAKVWATMQEVWVKAEHMIGQWVSVEWKLWLVKHSWTNRPSETTWYVWFNRAIWSDKDKFDSLFEPSFRDKAKEMYENLLNLRNRPITKNSIVMLADSMKWRSTSSLLENEYFMKALRIIADKMWIPNSETRLKSEDWIALTILMIDYQSRVRFGAAILPSTYEKRLELSAEELNEINRARKWVTLADLQTQMHGENIYGRWHVDKVSIWKYTKWTWVAENPDGSLDITTSSATLIVWANASGSNPSWLTDLFKTISATTVRITLEQVKELHRRAWAVNVNLNFAETWWTFLNLNLAITKWSVSFNSNKQISRMPSDLSTEMLNNRVDMKIIDSVIAWQLTIATAADMHFHRWDFSTSLVNYFLNWTYSYLVMNWVKAWTYSAADIAKLQAGQYTNAEAEAILTWANIPDVPTFTINGWATNTNNSTVTLAIWNDAKANAWFVSESATAPASWAVWWVTTKPTSYTLSPGDGLKNVYVYSKSASWTVQSTWWTHSITLDTVAPSGAPSFQWSTPDTKQTAYTWLKLRFSESLTWWSITSITSSTWWTVANISIDGNWDVQFDWTTPNAWWSQLTITWTDKAWNAFSLTKNVTLPNAVDSTPPSSPAFTITQWNYTNTTNIGINVTANADVAWWYISESSSVPTAWAAWWTASAPTTFTISSWDWAKTVYMFSKDAAWNVQSTPWTKSITLDTVVPSGTPSFQWTTPDTKLTAYSGLKLRSSESLTWWSISSITSSNWWAISNISIDGNWDIQFDWNTPNVWWSTLTITWTDKAGNSFTITKNVTLPSAPNNAPTFWVGSVADTLTIWSWMGSYSLPTATDADWHTLTYSFDVSRIWTWISFDTSTGVISWWTVNGPARTETIPYSVSDWHGWTATINVIFTIS